MPDPNTDNLIPWNPELSREAQMHLEKLRTEIEPQIAAVSERLRKEEERLRKEEENLRNQP
jgi:hypothetical protein